jgi:hypothetical protein
MTAIIIFLDITGSPMFEQRCGFQACVWPIGFFTLSRTAAWHDRQSLPFYRRRCSGSIRLRSGSAHSFQSSDLSHGFDIRLGELRAKTESFRWDRKNLLPCRTRLSGFCG